MAINQTPTLCISLARHPGKFGFTVHNVGYKTLGLNFHYQPLGLEDETKLPNLLQTVRATGIRGCSISMPFKPLVIPFLDLIDPKVATIGAVNTIVNENGKLIGYNTDYSGAKEALPDLQGKKVLMLGSGGVAKAIGLAVKEKGGDLYIANRTKDKAKQLATTLEAKVIDWETRFQEQGYLLINSTSIGLNSNETPYSQDYLNNFEIIYDVITSPIESRIIREAKELDLEVIPGYVMCVNQAAAQFKLYTGHDAPIEEMQKAVINLLGGE
ncbi:MAG: shikimate dehydrogenase [Nanoarchaeota archaeon]|nr:shikimate dehydrogenase [Nanoarchaeota archaeon]